MQPYAHPQLLKVLKHLLYVWYGCGMHFARFYSLNQHCIVAWFPHLNHLGFEPTVPNLVGAALIKKCSSYGTNQKKVPRVFSPKLVPGDLKSLPDGWQTLLPSWPILSISFSSKIDPLGIECVTYVPHACDSGFTVARGQHFPVWLWSQNHKSWGPRGKNYAKPLKYHK